MSVERVPLQNPVPESAAGRLLTPEGARFKLERAHQGVCFSLSTEISRLLSLQDGLHPEAVVLHCARLLEATTVAIYRRRLQPADKKNPDVRVALDAFVQHGLLDYPVATVSNSLRRLGNAARHMSRYMSHADAAAARILAAYWLNWAFLKGGAARERFRPFNREFPPELLSNDRLSDLLSLLESPAANAQTLMGRWNQDFGDLSKYTPVLATLVAEAFMSRFEPNRPEHTFALTVLEEACQRGPSKYFWMDWRLRQMMGLYYSRTGDLTAGLSWLESESHDNPSPVAPLPPGNFFTDPETVGIRSGIYKRMAWTACDRVVPCPKGTQAERLMRKAHEDYLRGWLGTGNDRLDTYLGINAAATALFLGEHAKASLVAGEVLDRLGCLAAYARKPGHPRLDFWRMASFGEAHLLRGEYNKAIQAYADALRGYPEEEGALRSTRLQMGHILHCLRDAPSVDDFEAQVDACRTTP